MGQVMRSMRWATLAGLGGAVTGVLLLLAYSFSGDLADPTPAIVGGYSIRRLPWTDVGVDLVVLGASVAVVAGAVAAWLAVGMLRRLVASVALALGAFWWILAVNPPRWAMPCNYCGPVPIDPLGRASSEPMDVIVLLACPAVVAGLVALSGGQSPLRRVQPQ